MALFKRKNTNSVLPEVDEYYQAERRDRPWLAWVLALVSVAVVVLIVVGLFLGGRWAYRQITKDNNEVATTDTNPDDDNLTIDGGNNADEGDQSTNQGQTNQPDSANQDGADTQGAGSENGQPTTPTTPSTGDSSGNATEESGTAAAPLPSTGPENIVGMFVGVSALAGGAHYIVSRRKAIR